MKKLLVIEVFVLMVMSIFNVAFSDEYTGLEWRQMVDMTNVGDYTIKITEFQYRDDFVIDHTEAEAVILDRSGNIVVKKENIGGWTYKAATNPDIIAVMPSWAENKDTWQRASHISIVDTPNDFPLLVFLSTVSSTSNITHSYIIYSITPGLQKIAEIDHLITTYAANKGNGTDSNVVGFYRNKNNDLLIDRLTTKGQPQGASNAEQRYSVETFKVTDVGVESINLRDFFFKTYKQLY